MGEGLVGNERKDGRKANKEEEEEEEEQKEKQKEEKGMGLDDDLCSVGWGWVGWDGREEKVKKSEGERERELSPKKKGSNTHHTRTLSLCLCLSLFLAFSLMANPSVVHLEMDGPQKKYFHSVGGGVVARACAAPARRCLFVIVLPITDDPSHLPSSSLAPHHSQIADCNLAEYKQENSSSALLGTENIRCSSNCDGKGV